MLTDLSLILISILFLLGCLVQGKNVLSPVDYRHYITRFNKNDIELYPKYIPNDSAWEFLKKNIPLLDCPDKDIEQTYYFRWWTFRKHIKKTDKGYVITEFLPHMSHAGKYNTISCASSHHIMEGRWLHNQQYIDDYIDYWYYGGADGDLAENLFRYSNWLNYAVWQRYLVDGREDFLIQRLPSMTAAYREWEKVHGMDDNLFWSYDVRDGMEESISGSRTEKNKRATISSYMYGEAIAISKIAALVGKQELAKEYHTKAEEIKKAINDKLWNQKAQFYKVMFENDIISSVRELHGYSPWYFNIPPQDYTIAWRQLFNPQGFYAPYGPTTAEQRHPNFSIEKAYKSHKSCRWDGPSWPYSTSHVLTSMANLLNHYNQQVISKEDYLRQLRIYARSHKLRVDSGKVISWIDENLNPYTGEWITRFRFEENNFKGWGRGGERGKPERGKAYNHSTYCDLIISGLIGVRSKADNAVVVNPLVPEDQWDWFCLDRIPYHGGKLTVLWDKTGKRYNKGKGFRVYYNGKIIHSSSKIEKFTAEL